MVNSLRNVGFDFFGCLHEIVEFGVVKDLQSIIHSTELDEGFVPVFLQMGKFVLCKSKVQKIR
jgi:dimeric dUTPase (all-alpha-NTP-PPase superfamily)